MSETLTANQAYKASNTSLSFKDWIEREKEKGNFLKNSLLEDVVPKQEQEQPDKLARFDSGIPKWVIATGALIVITAIAYKVYKK